MGLLEYDKPLIVYGCPWIPWNVGGMCLYPFIFMAGKPGEVGMIPLLVHEISHWHDQKEMGLPAYLEDWMYQYRDNLVKFGGEKEKMRAYVNITYEAKAFKAMGGVHWSVAQRYLLPTSCGQ